jgi:hypothetical protein
VMTNVVRRVNRNCTNCKSSFVASLAQRSSCRQTLIRADSTGSFEEAIGSGKFGEKGAGIQDLVCGGMHSLMIDEKGRVSFCNPPTLSRHDA